MAGSEKNNRDRNDPKHRSNKPGSNTGSESGMNASSGSMQGKERSMGGSQGTRDEARRDSSSEKSSGSAREEGGYGADSGYSDGSRVSNPSSKVRESERDSLDARHASRRPGTDSENDRPDRSKDASENAPTGSPEPAGTSGSPGKSGGGRNKDTH